MKIVHTFITCFVISFLLVFFDQETNAKEDDSLGYTVNLVQPKTQIDPEKSYFYIQTKPGETQTLEMRIKSTKKEPVTLAIYGLNAITGDEGTIEYSEDPSLYEQTLTQPLTSIIKVDTPTITVENYEEKKVKVEIIPSRDHYDGIKMGAIAIALDQGKKKESGVSTEFSYRIGLITAESGDEFNNGQTLVLNSVKASMKRGKKMILAELENPEPKVLENLTIKATMTDKETSKVIKRRTVENYSLAPNSRFEFEMDWGVENLPSGNYDLTLEVANGYQDWTLKKEFTITNQQAKKINKESPFQIVTPNWIKVTTIILAVVTIGNSGYLIWRRKVWQKQWKKRRVVQKRKQKAKKKLAK